MIDKDVFANEMGLLAGTYRYDADTPVLQAYYAALSTHMTTDEFRRAVRITMDTERFWPSPAVIRSKVQPDNEDRAQLAFRAVHDALSSHGGYRYLPAEISRAWDAPTWAGLKAIGGLREITECTEQRWQGLVKKFCRAYQEALTPRDRALTGGEKSDPRVAQLVASTAKQLTLTSGRDRAVKESD